MYEYAVKKIVKIVDGDTIDIEIDLGFSLTKKEIKVAPKKQAKPKTKQQKKEDKQKAGTKIVKKMGDKGRYDTTNQLKTLIVMNVIADTKSFFSAQKLQQDIPGFFSSATVPDAVLSDNNIAAYLLMVGSSQKMNNLVNSQYK